MTTEDTTPNGVTLASLPAFEIAPLHSVPMEMETYPPLNMETDLNYTNLTTDSSVFMEPSAPVYVDLISDKRVRAVLITIHVLISLVAIAGNSLVLFVIYRKRSLRKSPTVLFILNLAFCDLISSLVYRPLLLVELFLPFNVNLASYPYHVQQCQAASFLQGLFAAVGFLTIVAISQERLLLIVFPLQAKKFCSSGATKKVLVVIWIIAIVTALPIPIKFSQIIWVNLDGVKVSLCGYFDGEPAAVAYFWFTFVFYFIMPLIILSVTYAKIFHALYRRSEQLDVNKDAGGGKSMKVRRSLAKMMVSVAIVFALCWGPDNLYFLYVSCGGAVPSNGFFWAIFVEMLPIISSGINPFVYTLNSRTFRLAFKSLLTNRQRRSDFSIGRSFYGPTTYQQQSSMYCHSPSLSHNSFAMDSPALLRNRDICVYCMRHAFRNQPPQLRKSYPQNRSLSTANASGSPGGTFKRQWSCPDQMSQMRTAKSSIACTCGGKQRKQSAALVKQVSRQRMNIDSSRGGGGGGGVGTPLVNGRGGGRGLKSNWAPSCPSPLVEADESIFFTANSNHGDSKALSRISSSSDSSGKAGTPPPSRENDVRLIGHRLKGDVLL